MEQESHQAPDSPRRVAELKDRLERGEYAVDPGAVADAILRRAREMAMVRREHWWREVERFEGDAPELEPPSQSECSYPASGTTLPSPVVNVTPPCRSSRARRFTSPIHVIRRLGASFANAVSTALCAAGGAHTQSS
jgi:hypothetical protein